MNRRMKQERDDSDEALLHLRQMFVVRLIEWNFLGRVLASVSETFVTRSICRSIPSGIAAQPIIYVCREVNPEFARSQYRTVSSRLTEKRIAFLDCLLSLVFTYLKDRNCLLRLMKSSTSRRCYE